MEEVGSGERWGETRPQTKWKESTKGLRTWKDIWEGATGNAVLRRLFLRCTCSLCNKSYSGVRLEGPGERRGLQPLWNCRGAATLKHRYRDSFQVGEGHVLKFRKEGRRGEEIQVGFWAHQQLGMQMYN